MIALQLLAGLILGALAAAWHLLVLRWRARRLVRAGRAWALLSMPVGLAGVAAAVLIAAAVAAPAAWAVPLGLVLVRAVALRPGRA